MLRVNAVSNIGPSTGTDERLLSFREQKMNEEGRSYLVYVYLIRIPKIAAQPNWRNF